MEKEIPRTKYLARYPMEGEPEWFKVMPMGQKWDCHAGLREQLRRGKNSQLVCIWKAPSTQGPAVDLPG